MIWPRKRVSPIWLAIIENTRADVPESPDGLPIAQRRVGLVDNHHHRPQRPQHAEHVLELPSVSPTYFERKFRSTRHGMPIEPA